MNHEDGHIVKRIEYVNDRIKKAATGCGRDPEFVRLVAVSKTIPEERIRQAIEAGVTLLGENYIQEAKNKIDLLSHYPVSWHFIGHLQTNKAKYAVKAFDLIHTVDSLKLALELDKQARKINKNQDILIQVNISKELSKFGIDPNVTLDLIRKISKLKNIVVRGLMTMPPFFKNPEQARPYFKALNNLHHFIKQADMPDVYMEELSMGMTGDYKIAIEEGATLVRIGTAIFGKRN